MNKKLLVLIITAGVDMVGTFLVVPQLPFYAKAFGASAFVVAAIAASFNVATLLSAPYWGRFSDKYGRRPALLIALTGSVIGYIIFAFSGNIWMLFLSRIVTGLGGGTVGVIQAYVADETPPKDRAKALGWLSAATNLGVAGGPAIGSLSAKLGAHGPGLLAAAICLVNMYFAWRYLRESRVVTPRTSRSDTSSSFRVIWRVIRHSDQPASRLILIYAIGLGAFYGITPVLVLLLSDKYDITKETIGYFFSYMGLVGFFTRAFLLGPAVDRLGEARLARIGTLLLVLGLALLPLPPNILIFCLVSPLLNFGTAFTFPGVTSLLSRVIRVSERGVYMGVQQSFGRVSTVIFQLGCGLAYDRLGQAAPFWISAIFVAGTLFMGLDMESYMRTDAPAPVEAAAPVAAATVTAKP
ncbi:MAG TPA: MFS transporter [Gemmatimonadaceae bacterium]|nr:MFS transporter [Gemmatimonadaceae bacterium]